AGVSFDSLYSGSFLESPFALDSHSISVEHELSLGHPQSSASVGHSVKEDSERVSSVPSIFGDIGPSDSPNTLRLIEDTQDISQEIGEIGNRPNYSPFFWSGASAE
ncbi:hypothetical protein KIPB_009750, partial [Kipferlia bialata]